jgi:ubiquinone/menaquinone biosynthesis C-methylase UbiE
LTKSSEEELTAVKETTAQVYRCPYTQESLRLEALERDVAEVLSGSLAAPSGRQYPIRSGIPHLIHANEEAMNEREQKELDYYESSSDAYDAVIDWLFESFYEDEEAIREEMLSPLALQPAFRVLEIGCGTCRDSIRIARKLGDGGELFLQDLSPNMLAVGRERIRRSGPFACGIEYFVGNAAHLPFPDQFFDSAFHFGGLNLFSDKRRALAEMTRVVRLGGRVVVGDESLAPWLRETTYGRVLLNSNSLYQHEVPLDCLPENARNANVRWFLGNAFFLIDYTVGEGHPRVNLDLPILGARGGTHRSRYYGRMEGVTVEAKEMAGRAARQLGMSMHEWLDRVVRVAASRDLEE